MNGASTVIAVLENYIGNGYLVVLGFALLIYLFWKKKEIREYAILYLVCIFLICNETVYKIFGYLGESSTFYRQLWLVPVIPLVAWGILELLDERKNAWEGWILLALFLGFGWMYSELPENIKPISLDQVYLVSQDARDVCNIIDQDLTNEESVVLLSDDHIMRGIREWDAKIGIPTADSVSELRRALENNEGYYEYYVLQAMVINGQIDYIAVRSGNEASLQMLERAGFDVVGDTGTYTVLSTDYEAIEIVLPEN